MRWDRERPGLLTDCTSFTSTLLIHPRKPQIIHFTHTFISQSSLFMSLNTSHGQFLKAPKDPAQPPISVLLRGVNLSSSSKYPFDQEPDDGDIWSEAEGAGSAWFKDHPLPQAEIDDHLQNLVSWGFNIVRLVVTWEALEPFP